MKKIMIFTIIGLMFTITMMFAAEPIPISEEEYTVYSAVISQMQFLNSNPKMFVIEQATTLGYKQDDNSDLTYLEKEAKIKLEPSLTEDFRRKNAESSKLEHNFFAAKNVVLISKDEFDKIFSKGGWDDFYKSYPGSTGVIEMSRVGFNNDHTKAIIYFGYQAHYEAGAGYIIYLTKINNKWQIQNKVMCWVS